VCSCPITICSNLESDPSPSTRGLQDIYADYTGSIPPPAATAAVVALVPAPSSF